MTDNPNDFKIFYDRGEYIVVNIKGKYENHAHLDSEGVCELLVKLVCKQIVPNKPYLRNSAKRITRSKRYIQKIDNKINKDKNRQKYVNINKGVNEKFY